MAVIGIATAVTLVLMGLSQLQRSSDREAELQSKVLADSLAARMRSTAIEDRTEVMALAARRSGAELLLVDQKGTIVVDQSLEQLARQRIVGLLVQAEGLTTTKLGRVCFAASALSPPLQHLSVLAMVRAPAPAEGTVSLSNATAVLTTLLLGIALALAYTFMRGARDDVAFVRHRIAAMAQADHGGTDPPAAGGRSATTQQVPIRSLDQIGVLTSALNVLTTRFAAAERSYRADSKEAARLDVERSQFLAGLSHELRTPLNAILGFTHLLESGAEGPLSDDGQESLAMIRTSGEHLRSLIDDILDLSAMETGQLRLSPKRVNVYRLAREVVKEARGTIGDREISLTIRGSKGAKVYADPRRLRQVLTNLVSNALKFTAAGNVWVNVEKQGRGATLMVGDTGRGIAADLIATIFKAYQQGRDTEARRAGAGLGLAIARRLVLLHGGTIEVSSQLGKGSTFTIYIPDKPKRQHAAIARRRGPKPLTDRSDREG